MREVTVKDAVAISRAVRREEGLEVDPVDVFSMVRLLHEGNGSDANKVYGSEDFGAVCRQIPADLVYFGEDGS